MSRSGAGRLGLGVLVVVAVVTVVVVVAAIRRPAGPAPLELCQQGIAVRSPANTPGLVSDCVILLEAKATLGGAAAGWSADRRVATWEGVQVSAGRVRAIALSGSGLDGSIPAELGNLSGLEELLLVRGQLTGSIPPELGSLPRLEVLSLHSNQLTGSIPPELGNLFQLRFLALFGNQLVGSIPPELGNLSQLELLNLSGDQLAGSIFPVVRLDVLALDGNQLTGIIPPELGNLSQLEVLALDGNQLTGSIPPELGNLSQLEVLSLHDNQLDFRHEDRFHRGIPPELRPTASTDATLKALRLPGVSLEPAFTSGTMDHTASVAYAVTRITIAATTSDGNATLTFRDGSGNALADADGHTGGHQVDLSVGENVIKVRVTAANGLTTGTHTITVVRMEPHTP